MIREYSIYLINLPRVQKDLDKLVTKAEKLGASISYTVSEPYKKLVKVYALDPVRNTATTLHTFYADAVDVTVVGENPRLNGWEVMAKINTIEGSDIREVIPFEREMKTEWFHADCHCDHCGTNRVRKSVYICRNADGEERQVGRSCLKTYTGISPTSLIDWAVVKDLFDGDEDGIGEESYGGFHPQYRYYNTEKAVATAIDVIKAHGYTKSGEPGSTKIRVGVALYEDDIEPSKEAVEKAKEIREWLLHKNPDDLDSLLLTCYALHEAKYVKETMLGYLAYLPVAYDKEMERIAQEERARLESTSRHIGEVGKRITIDVSECKILTHWETMYGTTFLYKFIDSEGNVATWKTSKCIEKVSKLTGTVKEHSEYRGVAQTELTRCRIA